MKEEEGQMGPERKREKGRDAESLKKGGSKQHCQQRGTVVSVHVVGWLSPS